MTPECERIFPSGKKCGSPAMRGRQYCYYHQDGRIPRIRERRPRFPGLEPEAVADIYNPSAIAQTLSATLHALAAGQISLYKAQTLIYAMQLASNLNR